MRTIRLGVIHAALQAIFYVVNGCNTAVFTSPILPTVKDHATEIDEQLYSRQLYVYGASAQKSLMQSSVCVIGNTPLAAEVVKNIALGGVGKLFIYEGNDDSQYDSASQDSNTESSVRRIQGQLALTQYAQALNPNIEVIAINSNQDLITSMEVDKFTLVACIDGSLREMRQLNDRCRARGIRTVYCRVLGNCGMIFNDFLDSFIVHDADGEVVQEIPLEKLTVVSADLDNTSNDIDLEVQSIFEEKLALGLGDRAEVRLLLTSTASEHNGSDTFVATVTAVLGTHKVQVRCNGPDAITAGAISNALARGERVSIKKLKNTQTIKHQPLSKQLRAPSFVPSNECLPPKQQKAISWLLLACFKAFDRYFLDKTAESKSESQQRVQSSSFRNTVMAKLVGMGMKSPEKSIKEGGVGDELLERTAVTFFRAAKRFGQCPATVSIVGALASQEIIKGCTHIHTPISQFFMFEGLDALDPSIPVQYQDNQSLEVDATTVSMALSDREELRLGKLTHTEAVYGKEIASELARLKLFVIGSGAIGCELLKTFAMMGIGQGAVETVIAEDGEDSSDPSFQDKLSPLLTDIRDGGVVLTDMDHIERSNLNRQLLFREKHIGRSKSQVAAETIRDINPRFTVKALTKKVSPDTEDQFPDAFWQGIDVVATALDNVDARKYADSQCLVHKKWLFDSGTLGTKGNVQVVIPYASETYSSSADPPDESIPLCTLKSFPYQSDHCIAWARSVFDQLFVNSIRSAQQCLQTAASSNKNQQRLRTDVEKLLSSKSEDDIKDVLVALEHLPLNAADAVQWSIDLCKVLFHDSIVDLLSKHPVDEVDEEGLPFWSGSRKVPQAISLDDMKSDHSCRQFILRSAWLRSRLFGQHWSLEQLSQELDQKSLQEHQLSSTNGESSIASIIDLLTRYQSNDNIVTIAAAVATEEFEKDDLSLGHVDFVTSASNIRCKIYSLPEVSRLDVQKVAGRIVPALATTTAMVAGLVSLEIVKLAGEILRLKDVPLFTPSDTNDLEPLTTHSAGITGFFIHQQEILRSGRSIVNKIVSRFRQTTVITEGGDDASEQHPADKLSSICDGLLKRFHLFQRSTQTADMNTASNSATEWIKSRDLFMGRFRNAFINVARPMLAFATPVETELFSVPVRGSGQQSSFTIWDTISVPNEDISTLSVSKLRDYLAEQYGVTLQSLSMGDMLLYSDFLVSLMEDSSLGQNEGNEDEEDEDGDRELELTDRPLQRLLADAIKGSSEAVDQDVEESDRSRGDVSRSMTTDDLNTLLHSRSFIDLDIMCSQAEDADHMIKFPRLRVPIMNNVPPAPEESRVEDEENPTDFEADDVLEDDES